MGLGFQFAAVSSALLLEVLFVRLMDVLESVILLWKGAPWRWAGLMGARGSQWTCPWCLADSGQIRKDVRESGPRYRPPPGRWVPVLWSHQRALQPDCDPGTLPL